MSTSCDSRDLVTGPRATLLWLLPWVAVVIASFLGATARTLVWSPAFTLMGVACVVNARGCGRLHCFVTGPLYLGGAVFSLLVGLDVISLSPRWIIFAMAIGTFLAYLAEWIHGRYLAPASHTVQEDKRRVIS